MTVPVAACPAGHVSEEPDFCSVCGTAIGAGPGVPGSLTPGAGVPVAGEVCPVCGTPRAGVTTAGAPARYCEVCRYDFTLAAPGPPPGADPAPPAASRPAAPRAGTGWEALVTVDPALDTEPDPDLPAPTDAGERVFPLDLPELLIGRRDDGRGIRPELPVHDPGVSRRHALLERTADGTWTVNDLASANGTAVNGDAIDPGRRIGLADGDEITLGRWTRITLRPRSLR